MESCLDCEEVTKVYHKALYYNKCDQIKPGMDRLDLGGVFGNTP